MKPIITHETLTANLLLSLLTLPAFAQFSFKEDEMYSYITPFVAESIWDDNFSYNSLLVEESSLPPTAATSRR